MITYDSYLLDENKDTLLLIHGWNVSKEYMSSFINVYKNKFNIINIDLFKNLDKAYTIDSFIEEINQIVTKINRKKLVIISHSFGGKLAYFYSKKYPVESCLLIAPSLIKPRFNLIKVIKIYMYKLLKKLKVKIPPCLLGSKDYRVIDGYKRKTFLNCYNTYLGRKEQTDTKFLIVGFTLDKEIKRYQIRKCHKYLVNSKCIFYPGNHFTYLDYIKEICVKFNEYLS